MPQESSVGQGSPSVAELDAQQILDDVIGWRDPSHVFALFSGGHDSLCSTHLASRHPRFTGVVHVNTEIGIEGTRIFVRETCQRFGWPLLELRPPRPPFRRKDGTLWGLPGQTAYEAIIHRWGFPGPPAHSAIYVRLKERCIALLQRQHNRKGCHICGRSRKGHGTQKSRSVPCSHNYEPWPIVLVTGVRRQESRRRMGHIAAEQQEGRRIWCAPLVDWNDDDKRAYIARHNLPTNEIARRLCMSGECLCGAYARPEELAEIRAVSPETAAYIERLQEQVRGIGLPLCRWGEKPASKPRKKKQGKMLALCHSCEARQEEE